ncbi:ScbR family autoregulator-binding transcription factor [Streptomyces sp. O3]
MVQQERAARTRESLMRAAAETFADEGFALASLSTISKKAGVSNGALHFHFESKNALAQAVEGQAAEALDRITREVVLDGLSPLQELVDATHELMSQLAGDVVVRAGFGLCGTGARGDAAKLWSIWQQWIKGTLDRAERIGQLADGVSTDQAASAVLAATVGFEVLGGREPRWFSEEMVTRFWDLLLPRLAGPGGLDVVSSAPRRRGEGALSAVPRQK